MAEKYTSKLKEKRLQVSGNSKSNIRENTERSRSPSVIVYERQRKKPISG
jgi:hypothetical protein